MNFKLCRFQVSNGPVHVGLARDDSSVLDLAAGGIESLTPLLERDDLVTLLDGLSRSALPQVPLSAVRLLEPVEQQEIWAAGVTYLRSKKARMEESDFSATAYDRVYEAARPELFFKAMPGKVAAPGGVVGIRRDARWSVPEPELALVMNSRKGIVALTIGNDMSSRDIEGENLLYLPQAKIYDSSCAIGPFLTVGATETEAREWRISLNIQRKGELVFAGETQVNQIKRSFQELADFLFRSQNFPNGAVLLTGTGIVPPDSIALQEGDRIEIGISGVGSLVNSVGLV